MNRIRWLAISMSVALSVFGARLYDLQVTRRAQFAVQSDNNYQKDQVIRALRGEIRTQDGLLLATNRKAVDLIYTGGEVNSFDKIRYLAGIQPEMVNGDLPIPSDFSQEKEVVLARNIRAENPARAVRVRGAATQPGAARTGRTDLPAGKTGRTPARLHPRGRPERGESGLHAGRPDGRGRAGIQSPEDASE